MPILFFYCRFAYHKTKFSKTGSKQCTFFSKLLHFCFHYMIVLGSYIGQGELGLYVFLCFRYV